MSKEETRGSNKELDAYKTAQQEEYSSKDRTYKAARLHASAREEQDFNSIDNKMLLEAVNVSTRERRAIDVYLLA